MPPNLPQPETPWGISQRAEMLIDLGRPAEAVLLLRQVLAQLPGHARTLCLLSLATGNHGQYAEAEQWAQEAVQAAPEWEWGHRLLAIQRLNRGNDKGALTAAQEAVRLDPEQPAAWQTLAQVHLRLRRLRKATDVAEHLRQLAPDSTLTHETLGLIALRRRRWAEAEACCRCALALKPDSYYALNNLGVARLNQAASWKGWREGAYRDAIQQFYRATQLNPTEPLARHNLRLTLNRYLSIRWLGAILVYMALELCTQQGGTANLPWTVMGVIGAIWAGLAVRFILRYRALPPALRAAWCQHWRWW